MFNPASPCSRAKSAPYLLAVACCLPLGPACAVPSEDTPPPPFGAVSPDRQLVKRSVPVKPPRRAQTATPAGANTRALPADTNPRAIIVKFTEGSDVRLHNGILAGGRGYDASALYRLTSYNPRAITVSPLISRPKAELDQERDLGQYMSGWELADLSLYYRFVIDPARVDAAALVDELNALGMVEIAYPEGEVGLLAPTNPPMRSVKDCFPTEFANYTGGTTNNPGPSFQSHSPLFSLSGYEDLQLYLGNQGIHARAAWANGNRGQGVTIVDVETDWLAHEAYSPLGTLLSGAPPLSCDGCNAHGAAVVGMLSGKNDNYGVLGIASGSTIRAASVNIPITPTTPYYGGATQAILAGNANINVGDIILTEIAYLPIFTDTGFPLEKGQNTYDAIRTAVALGRVLVEGAGNSSLSLNNYDEFTTSRQDSGAIIVGAGTATGRLPITCNGPCDVIDDKGNVIEWGSNYGNRVNVQGWGECIVTSGYEDMYKGTTLEKSYTGKFAGTSSAAAMVAGAAALIQSHFKNSRGITLNSFAMRQLLINTGTAQAGELSTHIGPLPNVEKALIASIPEATITANGKTGSVTVKSGTAVNLTVSFNVGKFGGTPADWWVIEYYNGTYKYLLNGVWYSSATPIAQAPLVDLPSTNVYNAPLTGIGVHTIYAGVDLLPNKKVGLLVGNGDYDPLFYKTVKVTVQ